MFRNCFNLEYIKINSEKKLIVEDMSSTFENCNSLKTLDLSYLDTSNLKNLALIL